MNREELINIIRKNSHLYQNDDFKKYSDSELLQIKNALFLGIKSKLMEIPKIEGEKLRKSITQYRNLVVIYTTQTCEPCIRLFPKFTKIANEKNYRDFHFVAIDAGENPVAEQAVESHQAPLVTVYHSGLVIESKTVKSEESFRMLIETSL